MTKRQYVTQDILFLLILVYYFSKNILQFTNILYNTTLGGNIICYLVTTNVVNTLTYVSKCGVSRLYCGSQVTSIYLNKFKQINYR